MEPGKIFVGGISWDTNEDRLREYFHMFGEIVEAVIMKDWVTGRGRGFGFVIYADQAVAERVVRQKHIIDGRIVEAKKAVPRDDQHMISRNHGSPIRSPVLPVLTKKIFVGGLASTITEGDLKMYFDQFGNITDVVVMYDQNTLRPRGFGFITFDSEEAVERALIKTFHGLHGKMIEVKRAVRKELSPRPIQSPLGSGSSGLSRVSIFLNGYVQGYNSSPINIDGRQSLVSFTRKEFSPFSPSGYGAAMNNEPRMSQSFGEPANLFPKLSFEPGLSSLYNSNVNRKHDNFAELDGISRGSGLTATQGSFWSLWGNGSIKDSACSGNTNSMGFRVDIDGNAFRNSEAIWNSSPISRQVNVRPSVSNGLNHNYDREQVNLRSAVGLYGKDITTRSLAPSFASLDDGFYPKFADFDFGGSERPWPLGMKGSGSFEFGIGNAVSDVPLNNPAGLCW